MDLFGNASFYYEGCEAKRAVSKAKAEKRRDDKMKTKLSQKKKMTTI
jgi:hypothetical protein